VNLALLGMQQDRATAAARSAMTSKRWIIGPLVPEARDSRRRSVARTRRLNLRTVVCAKPDSDQPGESDQPKRHVRLLMRSGS
jgi:hypothetical protein